ncbi:MAG: hypothetical protein ABR498_01550 [Candidatus Dormibacteria bacterium]
MTYDESRPSAQPHDERQGHGAPAWWSQLDRGDLPDDAGAARHTAAATPTPPGGHRTRNWLINAAAMVVALLVVMLCLGVNSVRGALVAALIFGVPMILVVVTATIAARRAR